MLYTVKNCVEEFPELIYNDGVALGIRALIGSLKELNVPTEQIVEQLVQKFSLSMEEAQTYLDENN